MRKLLLSFLFLLLTSNCFAATEFISKINCGTSSCSGAEDYNTLALWEDAIDGSLTASDIKVFSHGGITGTIADGATVTGLTSSATGVVKHATTTQILIASISGTFQSGEIVYQTVGVNFVTLSNAGDSPIAVASVYDDDGELTGNLDIDGWTTNATNYVKITAPVGERHNGTPSSGATINYTTTGQYQNVITCRVPYTVIEWLVIKTTMNNADTGGLFTYTAAYDISLAPIYRNNIIVRLGGSTSTGQSGIGFANNNGVTYALNNIIIGFPSGIYANLSDSVVYNNTTKGNTVGINQDGGRTLTIINHLSIGDTTAFSGDIGNSSSKNNLSEDTTGHFGATYTTGTANGTTTNKLVNSGATFITNGVVVGSIVKNGTDTTYAYVTAVDSETQLTLSVDIFVSGETYSIYKSYKGSVTCVDKSGNNLHLVVGDTNAVDKGYDLGSSNGINYDIDNVVRSGSWDIGADEYYVASSRRRLSSTIYE